MAGLKKTSRTAGGIVDTSASKGKAAQMAEGLTGQGAAEHATRNYEGAVKKMYATAQRPPQTAAQALDLADQTNREINHGIVKEGVLRREDDSDKFPYTRVADLPLARQQFAQELTQRLNDPKSDPIETAAWIEWRANMTDHFWADGVGKSSKALAAIPLMKAGLPLPEYRAPKEMFALSQKVPYDPKQGGQTYLDDNWQRFLAYYRTLMPPAATP